MSSSQRSPKPSSESIQEVRRLLNKGPVRKYLERDWKVDTSREIELTGGSSKDGSIYYIDRDVPRTLRPFVLWHERVEKALRDTLGMSYARAHLMATAAEHILVTTHGKNWEEYKKAIAAYVRANEKRGKVKLPSGFDTGPLRESGIA